MIRYGHGPPFGPLPYFLDELNLPSTLRRLLIAGLSHLPRSNMRGFSRSLFSLVLAPALIILWGAGAAAAQGTYSITDLGTLNPTDQFSQAFGINNYGQVSGFVLTTGATPPGFLGTPAAGHGPTGTMIDLGRSQSGVGGAFKLNDYGQVLLNVAVNTAFGVQNQAHLWTPLVANGTTGSLMSIGGITGPDGVSNGYALNSSGQVAGSSYPGVCILWTPDLPNAPTGSYNSYFNGTTTEPGFGYSSQGGNASGLNDSGVVTGSMQAGFYSFPSTHWDPTFHYTEADIISPSYDPGSQDYSGWGNAINAAGNVTGSVI